MSTAHVVYAAMTGNNEEVTNIVCDSLTNLNVKVIESEISQTDVTEFAKADILVVCAYAYDKGAVPEEGLDFYDDLQEIDLTGKVYGVAGSGDKFYDECFNTTVDHFNEAFKKAGAASGAEKVKIDLKPYEEDIERLNTFAKGLVETTTK